MAYLELHEYDRDRYGLPERIKVPPVVGLRTGKAMKKVTGYDIQTALRLAAGIPRVDKDTGEAVYEDERDDDDNIVYEDDGVTPKKKLVTDSDGDAQAAYIWALLWHAGHRIPWDEFDVVGAFRFLAEDDEQEDEPAGKAETDTSSTPTT